MNYKSKRIKSRKDLNSQNRQGRRFLLLLLLFITLSFFTCKLSHIKEEDIIKRNEKLSKIPQVQNEIVDITILPPREQFKTFAKNFGIPDQLVKFTRRGNNIITQVPVDREKYDLYYTNFTLSKFLENLDWQFISGQENTAATLQTLIYSPPVDSTHFRFIIYYDKSGAYAQQKPKVSIIIKGFGSLSDIETVRWQNLNPEFCFSIIPDQPFSTKNMNSLNNSNHETLLELPLEPANYPISYPGKNAIFVQYNESQINSRIEYFLNQLPHTMGTITYMGSLAVTDQGIMTLVLNALKRRNHYFVDDLPIATSIAYNTAQRLLVTSYEKTITYNPNIYVDDKNNKKLKSDFAKLSKNPIIVTISNPDDLSFEFVRKLEQVINELDYQIVRVSEL